MNDLLSHLYERRFPFSPNYVWFDYDEHLITFPLWNLSGNMVGFQQYRPGASKEKKNSPREGKYFTYRNKGQVSVWGLESWHYSNTLFLTEGIFDACRLIDKGFSAVAALANDPNNSTKRWVASVRHYRPVVAVCDGDAAGVKLKKLAHDSFVCPPSQDFSDLSEEEVDTFLANYT